MKTKEKDECSYSFSNAIRTLVMVRKMGLEPTRHRHTHLKRACLPIPALPHKAMPWHCKKYFSIPAAKKQGLFGLFFKLLTTVPSRAKIVRYTASFTPFSRIAAKNFNFFQNRACIFAQALIYYSSTVKAGARMNMGAFPSGQWGQTVNLLLNASVVRIHQLPPKEIRN